VNRARKCLFDEIERHLRPPTVIFVVPSQHRSELAGKARQAEFKKFSKRVSSGKVQLNSPGIAQDDHADFEGLQTNCVHLSSGQFGSFEPDSAQDFAQHVSRGTQEQAQLVSPPSVTTGAIAKKTQLLFFDAIFHFVLVQREMEISGRDLS
jgi:hypothetical protein